jgi:RND family efflux transporter MFP subunit
MSHRKIASAALLSCIAALPGCQGEAAKPPAPKPAAVLVSTPVVDYVSDFEEFSGHTDAVKTVEVRARVTGYLDKVFFEDGTEVKEGDDLFLIDPRPYEIELARTEATLLQSTARLRRLEADHRRAMNLYQKGAISREEVDRIVGDYSEAEAAVGIATSNRDMAKLNLSFTKVRAPIGGRLSRRLVDPGNLVQQDTTPLTTIVTLDPMHVYFDIDERTMLRIRRMVKEGRIKARSQGNVIPVMAGLSDEEGEFPHKGMINFSDNKVDASTGTLRVRGVIDNPMTEAKTRVLSPGLFMRVRLPIGDPRKLLMIPEQAVQADQGRKFVYVVVDGKDEKGKPAKVAATRDVAVGMMSGRLRAVEKGLQPDDQVIVSGLQRVRVGKPVKADPADKPPAAAREVAAAPDAGAPAKKAHAGE